MPIYEYQCKACDHQHEVIQKISDAPLKECPQCGKPELSKLVSAAAFRLGGSGWYETDFKSGNKKNLAGAADSTGTKTDSKADKKSDSKAEKKTETKSESKKTA